MSQHLMIQYVTVPSNQTKSDNDINAISDIIYTSFVKPQSFLKHSTGKSQNLSEAVQLIIKQ